MPVAPYFFEVDYDGGASSNFVEVVVAAGTDVSAYSLVVYDKDRHELVTSNGGFAESLLVGPMMRTALDREEREALREQFPDATGPFWNGPPARRCLGVSEARALVETRKARHCGYAGA